MLFQTEWETTVPQPIDRVVDHVRRYIIGEKYISDQRGKVLFQGVLSGEGFALVPIVVEAAFGWIKPYPVQVRGSFSPAEGGTKVQGIIRMTDMFYLTYGLPVIALLVMFAYESMMAPGLVVVWMALFVPLILLLLGCAFAYARARLQRSLNLLQEAVFKA